MLQREPSPGHLFATSGLLGKTTDSISLHSTNIPSPDSLRTPISTPKGAFVCRKQHVCTMMLWCLHGSLGARRRPWAFTGHPYSRRGHCCSHPSPGAHRRKAQTSSSRAHLQVSFARSSGMFPPGRALLMKHWLLACMMVLLPWMTSWGSPSGWGADLQQSGLAWLGALRESCHSPDGVHLPPAAISTRHHRPTAKHSPQKSQRRRQKHASGHRPCPAACKTKMHPDGASW